MEVTSEATQKYQSESHLGIGLQMTVSHCKAFQTAKQCVSKCLIRRKENACLRSTMLTSRSLSYSSFAGLASLWCCVSF